MVVGAVCGVGLDFRPQLLAHPTRDGTREPALGHVQLDGVECRSRRAPADRSAHRRRPRRLRIRTGSTSRPRHGRGVGARPGRTPRASVWGHLGHARCRARRTAPLSGCRWGGGSRSRPSRPARPRGRWCAAGRRCGREPRAPHMQCRPGAAAMRRPVPRCRRRRQPPGRRGRRFRSPRHTSPSGVERLRRGRRYPVAVESGRHAVRHRDTGDVLQRLCIQDCQLASIGGAMPVQPSDRDRGSACAPKEAGDVRHLEGLDCGRGFRRTGTADSTREHCAQHRGCEAVANDKPAQRARLQSDTRFSLAIELPARRAINSTGSQDPALAAELTRDSAFYRGAGALGQHDQTVEFPPGELEGAFALLRRRPGV